MNLTALKYVVSLAREKHFGRAARACGVAQPTLSVAVRNLEEELGVQLFERSPMDVRVTSAGLPIVRHAFSVLQDVHAIEEIARNSQNPNSGVLRLGVVHNLNPEWVPQCMQRIRSLAPQMPVLTHQDLCVKLLEQLRDGVIDGAVMDIPITDLELKTAPIFAEPLFVAVGPHHPWAELTEIDIAAMQQETLLLPSMGDCLLDALTLTHPELAGLKTSKSGMAQEIKGATLESIAHMVVAGMGVSLLPRMPSSASDQDDLRYLKLSGMHLVRQVVLVWRPHFNREPSLMALLDVLRASH
jgi:LysR family transcriptional regulator, hydrogen peroxide-inducible genes activator